MVLGPDHCDGPPTPNDRRQENPGRYSTSLPPPRQEAAAVDRFVYPFEKTATRWERNEFRVVERCKKRSHLSSSNSGPDRSSNKDRNPTHDRSTGGNKNKSTKRTESTSGPSGQSILQVTAHCDKLNYKRKDCKPSGSHPDFNKTGAWIRCSSCKEIAE